MDDNKKEKLKKAILEGKVSDKTTLQVFNMITDLEEKVDTLSKEVETSVAEVKSSEVSLEKVLESVRGTPGKPGKDGTTPIKGQDYFDGIDGKDYVLTEEDKSSIAKQVEVPIVEKVIELTEVIKEIPIVTEVHNITNEIKEVAKYENREQIVTKINQGGENKIELEQISGIEQLKTDIKNAKDIAVANSLPITTTIVNGKRAKNLNFTNATVDIVGDTANVTTSGGSGGAVDSVNGQTGVVVLDTGDITEAANLNYVSDAELVVIGNTSGTNTGDQTSIVGITGTKAQFDTAVTDGNFLYVGDVTQYTDELAQDATGAMAANSTFVSLAYNDATPSLTPSLSATGTPSSSTYLRGDNTWATIAGGGDVTKVGTPVNNQLGVWTGDGTIEGDTALTYDSGTKVLQLGCNTVVKGADGYDSSGETGAVYFGDTNHGFMGTHSNGVQVFTYGHPNAITLCENGGRVGIGASFGTTIGVASRFFIDNATNGADKALVIRGNASQLVNLTEWQTSGTTPLTVVDSAGKIGIGTSSPQYALSLGASTSSADGIGFGTDVEIYRSAAGQLYINSSTMGAKYTLDARDYTYEFTDGLGIGFTVASGSASSEISPSSGLRMGDAGMLRWSPTGMSSGGSDTGFSRLAAGSLALGNGTSGDITGKLSLASIELGHASDTTLTRSAAGVVQVEGKTLVNLTDGGTFAADVSVPDEAYGAGWNGSMEVPTKNALYDKIETLGGGSGITRTQVTTSGSITLGSTASVDYVYYVAGAHTLSMPSPNNNRYTIKNNHSANITVDTAGAELIEGAASISIAPGESVDITSDTTNWFVV